MLIFLYRLYLPYIMFVLLTASQAYAGRKESSSKLKFQTPPNMEAAFKRAAKLNKSVLLLRTSPRSLQSRRLEQEILPNKVIWGFISKYCLSVVADTTTKEGKALAGAYDQNNVPEQILFNSTGEKLSVNGGFNFRPYEQIIWMCDALKIPPEELAVFADSLATSSKLSSYSAGELDALAALYLKAGKKDKVKGIYGPDIEKKLKTVDNKHSYAGFWAYEMDQMVENLVAVQLAAVKQERTSYTLWTLAGCYWQAEKWQEAMDTILEAQKMDPDDKDLAKTVEWYRSRYRKQINRTAPPTEFVTVDSMEQAFEKAAKEKKSVYLLVVSPGCGWCKHMENVILRAPSIKLLVEQLCVPIKADISTPLGKKLAAKYLTSSAVPRQLLFSSDGNVREVCPGAFKVPKDGILWFLKHLSVNRSTLLALQKLLPSEEELKDATFHERSALAGVLYHLGDKEGALRLCGPACVPELKSAAEKNSYGWFWSYQMGGNFQSALDVQLEAVKQKRDSDTLDTLAYCYYVNENFAKAIETQEQALKVKPKSEEFKERLELYKSALEKQAGKKSAGDKASAVGDDDKDGA